MSVPVRVTRHSYLVLICFVTDLRTLIVCVESFNLWSFSVIPRNVSGTDRVPETFFLIFIFNRGLWTRSILWVIPNVINHRQNPVDLQCEVYCLAASVVNTRCYHGNFRSTCIRFASAYVPVLFSPCSLICRLTRMEGDISVGVRNCCMKLHFLIL